MPPPPSAADAAHIARQFGGADGYERHAQVQAAVAGELARRVGPGAARVLEIGCGTGLLTRALVHAGVRGDWLVTDLAPEMVARCRAAMAEVAGPEVRFAVLDANGAMPVGPWDLIVSSLAFQWLADLPGALAAMAARLAPGGALCFATLVAGTFAEWQAAHAAEGVRAGGIAYPEIDALSAMAPAGGTWAIEVRDHVAVYPDARAFLHAVKGIGAGAARADHVPLSAATMRRVMRAFDRAGAPATYRVAYCRWRLSA